MNLSGKILKRAPLPWAFAVFDPENGDMQIRLDVLIRRKFIELFGERSNLSTRERRMWGEFLASHGILWELKTPKVVSWQGWEFTGSTARPEGVESQVKVVNYYVPKDLAMKMLVLGELPGTLPIGKVDFKSPS